MARLAPREDDHLQIPPSIMRAQLTPKPPSRDVSFSAYLKPNDTLLPTDANHPSQRPHDSEISIFDAEKYFKGAHDPNNKPSNPKQQPDIPTTSRLSLSTPKQSVSSVSRLSSVSNDSYGRNYRTRSFHATPTASSEASWNSQTGLLTNPPNLAPISIRNIPSTADRFTKKPGTSNWFLRGNICPCSGKKSVNIKHSNSDTETSKLPPTPPPRIVQLNRITSSGGSSGYLYPSRQSSPLSARSSLALDQPVRNFIPHPHLDQNKFTMTTTITNPTGNGFTFPILNNKAPPPPPRTPIVDDGETPRDSIEVFQPRSPKSRRASYDDDVCSDASSDLFEIESFSTIRRDSLDDPAASFNVRRLQIAAFNKSAAIADEEEEEETVTPSIAPTECYPPSEVSVDWSVTTAEGFSVAAASEFGFPALIRRQQPGKLSYESKKKGSGGGGGLLTSCRCEKAVNVAEIRPAVAPARSNVGHRHSV